MLLGQTTEDYDKHFILTADIDIDPNLPGRKVFNKAVIAPDINDIEDGFQGTPFTGFFDGNDHAIYHLKIEGKSNLGLFGQVAPGARISKLCLESVDVNGTGDYIGSLAGGNAGSVSESCSNGTIRGINNVGGLFGSNCESITMCYSTGTVNGNTNVGGLVGGNSIDILFSYRTGSILRVDTNMRITKSYSTSNISGNGSVGGIVGYNDSFGVVIMSYSAGVVKGSLRVGGLIGRNAGGIETCYSTAVVVGTTDVGGLAGSSTSPYPIATGGYATHSFWDIQTSGQAISAGGIGFTTAEMQTASIFIEAGWDFVYETTNGTDDIWWIDEGNDYPRLWWEPRFEPYQMVVSGYVDITTVYQELEGFGASGIWWDRAVIAHPLKNLIYDCIFGQLGLDIYKLRNAYEIPNGEEYIINSGEIVSAAQLSLGHPIKIMISSLTPPAYLKSNSDTAGGTLAGSARGGGYRYDMFAQWWLDSLAEYSAYGITADYISIQSSPDVQAGSVYDSCKFTPTETTDYAGYNVAFETVYQKLNSEMTIMPKMLAPETWSYYSPQEYIDALIEQNNVFGFGHRDGDFGDPDSFIQNMENFAAQYGHKPLFTMSFNNDEVSFNAAMNLAISIHNRMVYENLCSFILSDLFKGEGTEGGLVTIDNPWDEFNPGYTINPVYYAFKQYSAFTDPGWHRVEISIDSDELRACAFISPDEDQLSIIIINTSVVGINLMLTLENFITENSGVYRTSENENAAYIGTFDNTEPLSLPAQSITTVNLVD
jgi:glucuronoarabinoxylan endo-1,4-beta-xylanase